MSWQQAMKRGGHASNRCPAISSQGTAVRRITRPKTLSHTFKTVNFFFLELCPLIPRKKKNFLETLTVTGSREFPHPHPHSSALFRLLTNSILLITARNMEHVKLDIVLATSWMGRGSKPSGERFLLLSTPIHTGHVSHPTFCTMGTRFFAGDKASRNDAEQTPTSSTEVKHK